MRVVFSLPTSKYILIASFLRNFGSMIAYSFLPIFFKHNFFSYYKEYSIINALVLSVGGFVGSLAGGIMADKFEKKSYMTKAIICISGCILSFPFIALGTFTKGNFNISIICYGFYVLISSTYSGLAITMM